MYAHRMIGKCLVGGSELFVEWNDGELEGSDFLIEALRIFVAEWPSDVQGPVPSEPTPPGLAEAQQARNTIAFVLGLVADEGTITLDAPELASPDDGNPNLKY